MPRPKTKDELLEASQKNFQKLDNFVDSFYEEEKHKEFPEGTLNRNIRDVIAHLHHWNTMTLGWYEEGKKGEKPKIPAEGYTWKTLPELNRVIQKKYSQMNLLEAQSLFSDSFKRLLELMKSHSDEELFEKKRYKWTGSTSLGAYLISATSSHYDWAYKLIKNAKK